MSRSKLQDNNTQNQNQKRTKVPLVAQPNPSQMLLEDLMSRAPSKTSWAEEMLVGASEYELEKSTPLSEDELKRIFPRATATMMRDPLTNTDKQRIHDNIRRDPCTASSLFTYCYFLLGPESTITMGLDRKYATEERKKEHMKEIMNNSEYLDILEDIMNRDDTLELQTRKLQLVASAAAFGRAVQVKQYDKKGFPCRLVPLSSTRLGRWYVDKNTHDPLGVEYLDYTRDRRILLIKDIIHYENNDMIFTPRSRYYGMAYLEPTMAIGERNRVINEIARPELGRKHWAPILLVKVNTGSQTKLNQIRDMFSMPGKTQVYNDVMEVTQVQIQLMLDMLQKEVEAGNQDIYRALTVPQGIGWSFDPNHATMENSLLAWYNGVLAFKRSEIDNVFWHQLYKPQLEMIWADRQVNQIPDSGLVNYLVQRAEEDALGKPQLPFRITTEFKNIKTVGFLELASALLGYKNAGIITTEIALKESGLEQYVDDMAEKESEQVTLGNNLLQQEQQIFGEPVAEEQPARDQPVNQGIKGVLDVSQRSLTRGL